MIAKQLICTKFREITYQAKKTMVSWSSVIPKSKTFKNNVNCVIKRLAENFIQRLMTWNRQDIVCSKSIT